MVTCAGVDLGATNLSVVVADGDGERLGSSRRSTPSGPTGIDVTEAVLGSIREACADAGVGPADIDAVGIGSIGPLDLAAGTVENPANLPDTIDRIPLVGPIEKLVETKRVYLHNDTTAGVIGERFHSARNPDDMVYLTFSSGIGAGVCVDGRVLSGWDGNVGEVGHFTVDPDGRRTCGCGRDGHWEAYCSGNAIPEYAKLLYADHVAEERIHTSVPLDDPDFSAADVYERVDTDAFAATVIDRVNRWNAIGVATIVHAYAPLVINVGGAVTLNNASAVIDPIEAALDRLVMSNVPDVRLTTLGDDVVVQGALASALTGGTGDREQLWR